MDTAESDQQAYAESAFYRLTKDRHSALFSLRGDWTILNLSELEDLVDFTMLGTLEVADIRFHCGGLQQFDLAGAWLLYRTAQNLRQLGYSTDFEGFRDEHMQFIDEVLHIEQTREPPAPPLPLWLRHTERLALALRGLSMELARRVDWWLLVTGALMATLRRPSRFRWIATTRHIRDTGISAIGIVALMAFLVAIVLGFQGASQLEQFGAQVFTVDLVSLSILREMGGLLTAILVAGRSGSAFAAEIGVMRLNEELDAMKTMGVDPIEALVIPRMTALVISLPLLTFIADIAGLIGALAVTYLLLDIPTSLAIDRLLAMDTLRHFWVGMAKAPFFALVIGMIGTYRGYYVSRSADAVGRSTTAAVVESVFTVIVVDAVFSILFTELGW